MKTRFLSIVAFVLASLLSSQAQFLINPYQVQSAAEPIGESVDLIFDLTGAGDIGDPLSKEIVFASIQGTKTGSNVIYTWGANHDFAGMDVPMQRTTLQDGSGINFGNDYVSLNGVNYKAEEALCVRVDLTDRNGNDGKYEGFNFQAGSLVTPSTTVSLTGLIYLDTLNPTAASLGYNPAVDWFSVYDTTGGWAVVQQLVQDESASPAGVLAHNSVSGFGGNVGVTTPGWYRFISRINVDRGMSELLVIDPATRYLIGYAECGMAGATGGFGALINNDYISMDGGSGGWKGLCLKWGFFTGNWLMPPISSVSGVQTELSTVTVSWTVGATGVLHDLERSDDDGASWDPIDTDLAGGTFVDSTVGTSGSFKYRVKAHRETKESTWVESSAVAVNDATFKFSFPDNFNRANELDGEILAPWEHVAGSTGVLNNRIWFNAAGSYAYYGARPFSADQRVKIKRVTGLFDVMMPVARGQAAAVSGYYADLELVDFGAGTYNVRIGKVAAGVYSTLATGATITFNPLDELEISATGIGTVTLKAYLNGVEQCTTTDSTSPFNSGQPGVIGDGALAEDFFAIEL